MFKCCRVGSLSLTRTLPLYSLTPTVPATARLRPPLAQALYHYYFYLTFTQFSAPPPLEVRYHHFFRTTLLRLLYYCTVLEMLFHASLELPLLNRKCFCQSIYPFSSIISVLNSGRAHYCLPCHFKHTFFMTIRSHPTL